MKNSPTTRLLVPLLDKKVHCLGDYYDWICEIIQPQLAIRAFERSIKMNRPELEERVKEGKRIIIRTSISRIEKLGYVVCQRPEAESPRSLKSRGFCDLRKMNIQLTEAGMKHVLEGSGVFACIVKEIKTNLKHNKIRMSVSILEDSEILGLDSPAPSSEFEQTTEPSGELSTPENQPIEETPNPEVPNGFYGSTIIVQTI